MLYRALNPSTVGCRWSRCLRRKVEARRCYDRAHVNFGLIQRDIDPPYRSKYGIVIESISFDNLFTYIVCWQKHVFAYRAGGYQLVSEEQRSAWSEHHIETGRYHFGSQSEVRTWNTH